MLAGLAAFRWAPNVKPGWYGDRARAGADALAGGAFAGRRTVSREWRESTWADGVRSTFAFPILAGTRVVAVIQFFSMTDTEPSGQVSQVVADICAQLERGFERDRPRPGGRRSTCGSALRCRWSGIGVGEGCKVGA